MDCSYRRVNAGGALAVAGALAAIAPATPADASGPNDAPTARPCDGAGATWGSASNDIVTRLPPLTLVGRLSADWMPARHTGLSWPSDIGPPSNS
jgi:hypothetical protein